MNPALRDLLRAFTLVWICFLMALLLSACGGGDWEDEEVQPPKQPCGRECAV